MHIFRKSSRDHLWPCAPRFHWRLAPLEGSLRPDFHRTFQSRTLRGNHRFFADPAVDCEGRRYL